MRKCSFCYRLYVYSFTYSFPSIGCQIQPLLNNQTPLRPVSTDCAYIRTRVDCIEEERDSCGKGEEEVHCHILDSSHLKHPRTCKTTHTIFPTNLPEPLRSINRLQSRVAWIYLVESRHYLINGRVLIHIIRDILNS